VSYRKQLYREYLKSEAWKLKSDRARAAADFRCQITWNGQRCLSYATETHHDTYRRLFYERPSDLRAVCRSCHMRLHNILQKAANDNQLQLPLKGAGKNDWASG